jgi:hypothetical protein
MNGAPRPGVVGLLTAQAFAFGVTLALLLVPANSLFLDAYGSKWLPVTYIATAIVGSAAAALIARAARTTRLIRVATATLGGFAAFFAASWAILVAGGDWVSGALLVMFPIALQIGFVFIGGQAGRLLDVRQMKELFPRVVSGFAMGFLVGGAVEIPLLALLGSTENLFLATTAAQLSFLALLLLTERRFPEVRAAQTVGAPAAPRLPLRKLFSGLVALLLIYQLLSAMGSQVVDFLLFDRAAARYTGSDLTRFLSTYTALLNLVDIIFLTVLAGPLMRRFGLRLGLTLNPAVVAGVLGVMGLVAAGSGAASLGVFALAGFLRIADLTTTDGTTRTSINAAYQVVEPDERLAVQTVVEGVGVPVAIGATGVLLLVLHALDFGVGAVIAFGLLLSALWTAVAVGVYGSYRRKLADAMRRRPLTATGDLDDAPAVRALLGSDDARDVRLGLDLLAGLASPASEAELRRVAEGADPEARVRALVQLAAGDARAAAAAQSLARELAESSVAADRRAAAAALGEGRSAADRAVLVTLLDDPEASVRVAALDAVAAADAAEPEIVRRVVAAAGEARTTGRAAAAIARLGDAALPPLAAALANAEGRRRLPLVRSAATAAADHGIAIVAPALGDPDRSVVLAALDALDAAGADGIVAPDVLDSVFDDAAALAAQALSARSPLGDQDGPLLRALDDEIDLARRLIIAVLALRHGDRIRAAVRVVEHGAGARRALAVEALDVVLSRPEAAVAIPLVCHGLAADEQAPVLQRGGPPARSRQEWIADVAYDPDGVWRSPWLAACALAAAAR